jgi:hypothetical protein
MFMTGAAHLDAERAFTRLARSRRRAALTRRLRHLPVYDDATLATAGGSRIREIPLDRIRGTLEPSKAPVFDCCFRPAASARARWQQVWLAEHRGVVLPPIAVVAVGDDYAISDGHHRVSVALARGALTIDATVTEDARASAARSRARRAAGSGRRPRSSS